MQTAFTFFEPVKLVKKVAASNAVVLTDRDLEIISFVNEMKFASLEDLHFKFFRLLSDGKESKSQWWARERIMSLVKAQYISRVYSFNERTAYFLGTQKGYLAVLRRCPERSHTRPLERIDFKTFEHDKLLLQLRLRLEDSEKVTSWISDRQLFQFPEYCLNMGEGNQPDAIYTNAAGEKVAFELEIARKSKKRYADKIRTYAYLMREQKNNLMAFKKVHFVVANDSVFDLISSDAKIYQSYFEIQKLSDYQGDVCCQKK